MYVDVMIYYVDTWIEKDLYNQLGLSSGPFSSYTFKHCSAFWSPKTGSAPKGE